MMKNYTIDIKVRFHVNTNDHLRTIDELIEGVLTGSQSTGISPELELLGYEEGSWYLFPVGDSTDEFIKRDLAPNNYISELRSSNAI